MAMLTTILWINLGFAVGLACGIGLRIGGGECGPQAPVPRRGTPHASRPLPDCLQRLTEGRL